MKPNSIVKMYHITTAVIYAFHPYTKEYVCVDPLTISKKHIPFLIDDDCDEFDARRWDYSLWCPGITAIKTRHGIFLLHVAISLTVKRLVLFGNVLCRKIIYSPPLGVIKNYINFHSWLLQPHLYCLDPPKNVVKEALDEHLIPVLIDIVYSYL